MKTKAYEYICKKCKKIVESNKPIKIECCGERMKLDYISVKGKDYE